MKILKTFLITGILFLGFTVAAQLNPFDLEFPIAELGNCGSLDECKAFCDVPENQMVCMDWARAQGIIKEGPEVDNQKPGPGGCVTKQECEVYCDGPEHAVECIEFAVAEGFMTREEADRILADMNKTGPGGCTNHEECDAFCRNPQNSAICLQFAVDEGMLTQEEADFLLEREQTHRMRGPGGPGGPKPGKPQGPEIDEAKAAQILEERGGPGGCATMEECDVFCSTPGNDEECMSFALEHGLISGKEAEKFKKIMTEGGPGGCKGQAECDAYCDNPDHMDECMQFAIDNELVPPEEIEMMKKMKDIGGPGGCRGQRECDEFCSNPENGEICFQFAREHGLMPPEEIEMIEREMEIMKRMDRGEMGGPGGCKNREECDNFCRQPENMEECMKFGADQGMRDRDQMDERMMMFKEMEHMMRGMKERGELEPPMMGDFGEFQPSGPRGTMVIIKKKTSDISDLIITDPSGIEYFSFQPQSGGPYSGGLGGCPNEFKSDTSFFITAQYPITAVITNCSGEETEFIIDSSGGEFSSGGSSSEFMPPEGFMQSPEGFMPPEGFEEFIPPEFMNQGEFMPFEGDYQSFQKPPEFMPIPPRDKCDFDENGMVDEKEKRECYGDWQECVKEGERFNVTTERMCCEGLMADSICDDSGNCIISERVCKKFEDRVEPIPAPIKPMPSEPIGGETDEHGCVLMGGYSWCEAKQKCLRVWEEPCDEGGCKDMCGDGMCQEFVCTAVGCPCAETKEICPMDCPSSVEPMPVEPMPVEPEPTNIMPTEEYVPPEDNTTPEPTSTEPVSSISEFMFGLILAPFNNLFR